MSAPLPALIYDGDCQLCSRLARFTGRYLRARPDDYAIVAWQAADLDAYGLTAQQCQAAAQWVDSRSRVHSGAQALAHALCTSRHIARPAGWLLRTPGIRQLAAVAYRVVATNRHRLGDSNSCPTQ